MSFYNGSSVPSGNVGGYYGCEADNHFKFKTAAVNYTVDADFQDMKLEPFVSKNATDAFGNGEY